MGTGVLMLLGGEVENRCVRRGPTSYSVIGEAMFRPQSASEHAIPTSRQNLLQIQYLNPKPDVASAHAHRLTFELPGYHHCGITGKLSV